MSETRAAGGGAIASNVSVGDGTTTAPKIPKGDLINEVAEQQWKKTIKIMIERKIFSSEDVPHIIQYCNAIANAKKAEADLLAEGDFTEMTATGSKKPHPLVNVQNIFVTQSLKLASQLGLTAISRARMSGGGDKSEKEKDDFEEF